MNRTNKQRLMDNRLVVTRECGGEEGKEGGRRAKMGQICGARKKSNYGRGTHSAIYICLTVKLYT